MKKTIFLIDDSMTSLLVGAKILEPYYNIVPIPSGKEALQILMKRKPDLILLDVTMPEMDGFEVIAAIKSIKKYKNIPIIFLTALSDPDTESRGLTAGAVDFITKPFSAPVLLNRVALHVDIASLIQARTEQLLNTYKGILSVMSDLLNYRDSATGDHSYRTSRFVSLMVRSMLEDEIYIREISGWNPDTIGECALLHDIGKIHISDTILNKPGRLTKDEFETIKTHCTVGVEILQNAIIKTGDSFLLENARIFAESHHEKWDGSGYPNGLSGEEIPLHGRIMAIVDVYEALTSDRSYKNAISHEDAVKIILEESGKHFDPILVNVFCKLKDQFKRK